MPVLDIVDKIFRSRHKSQDRDRNRDRDRDGDRHSRDDMRDKRDGRKDKDGGSSDLDHPAGLGDSKHAVMVSSNTQTPLKADDVIAAFPSSAFSHPSPDPGSKSRKREYEADSNSGTWPKSRSGLIISSTVPSTVMLVPNKERPSIKDPGFFQPPDLSYNKESGVGGVGGFAGDRGIVSHSQQSSDANSLQYPGGAIATQPLSPIAKSSPMHFSVGVMPTTTPPPSSSRPPAFSKQWPPSTGHYNNQYPPPPHPHHHHAHPHSRHQHRKGGPPPLPPHTNTIHIPKPTHYADAYSGPIQPGRVTSGPSHRPPPHHADKQWPWGQPPTHLGHPQPPPYSSDSRSPEAVIPAGARPTSLEVPQNFRVGDVPGSEVRVASPIGSSVGSGLSARSGPSSSYTNYNLPG
jgi:hypothetical protein